MQNNGSNKTKKLTLLQSPVAGGVQTIFKKPNNESLQKILEVEE
jgi:hypothetical protein